jgi:hypothetical protein
MDVDLTSDLSEVEILEERNGSPAANGKRKAEGQLALFSQLGTWRSWERVG